nr:extensin-like [Penaeus vannamei]
MRRMMRMRREYEFVQHESYTALVLQPTSPGPSPGLPPEASTWTHYPPHPGTHLDSHLRLHLGPSPPQRDSPLNLSSWALHCDAPPPRLKPGVVHLDSHPCASHNGSVRPPLPVLVSLVPKSLPATTWALTDLGIPALGPHTAQPRRLWPHLKYLPPLPAYWCTGGPALAALRTRALTWTPTWALTWAPPPASPEPHLGLHLRLHLGLTWTPPHLGTHLTWASPEPASLSSGLHLRPSTWALTCTPPPASFTLPHWTLIWTPTWALTWTPRPPHLGTHLNPHLGPHRTPPPASAGLPPGPHLDPPARLTWDSLPFSSPGPSSWTPT